MVRDGNALLDHYRHTLEELGEQKNAQDTKSGAGQYFTPRALIQAMWWTPSPQVCPLFVAVHGS